MKIYHYHPTTGEYIGEGMADKDPLEENNWLIPAHATHIAPPPQAEGKSITFDGAEWQYVDVEVVAEKDVDNTSPSTETAFQKVVKLLESVNAELVEVKNKLQEKEERLSVLEQKSNEKEVKEKLSEV